MRIADKWTITKTLFKNYKTIYAKVKVFDIKKKAATIAIIPFDVEIDHAIYKNVERAHEANCTRLLVPQSVSTESVNAQSFFIAQFNE